jgi:deazaflavin-dependent oxidoreductase (nitroreductase family)
MSKGAFRRWMYRGQRPNWLARMLIRVDVTLGSLGIGANYGLVLLEVTGRTTGRTISVPVAVVVVNGQRYLVSMLGENAQWVRNIRAAGGRAVVRSGDREAVQLEEVPIEQRAPILKVYLKRAPGARAHMRMNGDEPLAEFAKIAGDYPVFRVTSAQPAQSVSA